MVTHVSLMTEQEASALHRTYYPRQASRRHVSPPVCCLKEMRPNGTPKPKQSLRARGIAKDNGCLYQRAQKMYVRNILEPRDTDDGCGVVMMKLKSSRQNAKAWYVLRRIIQDEVDDATRHIHVEETQNASDDAGAVCDRLARRSPWDKIC